MADEADHRRFYRSLRRLAPAADDFLLQAALGLKPRRSHPPDSPFWRRWAGLSVFTTYEGARDNAEGTSWRIGRYIAELVIPDDVTFVCEGPDDRDHALLYDVSGDVLVRCVSRIFDAQVTLVLVDEDL